MRRPEPENVTDKLVPAPIHLPRSEKKARQLFRTGRDREAFFAYYDLAASGSHACQAVVALMYLLGYVECDDPIEIAHYWATKSSVGGDAYGDWVLAWALLETGDYDEGLSRLIASAEKGFAPAFFHLGHFASNGVIVRQDLGLTRSLLKIAARLGHAGARSAVSYLDRRGLYGPVKQVFAYVVSPIQYVMRILALMTSSQSDAQYLIYARFFAFEADYLRTVKGKFVSSEYEDKLKKMLDEIG